MNNEKAKSRKENQMRILVFTCCMLFAASCLDSGVLFAKPERHELPAKKEKAKRAQAQTLAGGVDLSKVGDPEVRTALQAVFAALNLKSKK